ncbi:MAG: type I phosphomannose isomerase catalytic subunit [Victivallales bacterium]|jgi:mannose-6-phosphate isomerase
MKFIEKDELYPLLFDPIYVEVVWGGSLMSEHLKRDIPETQVPIGESWEISDREGAESVVSNGPLKGISIRDLIVHYEKALVGNVFNGGRFPLLIKLIDAGKRLSLQVHPDERACEKTSGAQPKTEMWYVIASKPGSKIIAGLKPTCTQRRFIDNLHSNDIENCLQVFNSVPGDAFFISAGRAHAIGGGNLLLEIQQNSNTTYRISDWGRLGSDGTPRELHVEKALECINFTDRTSPRIAGVSGFSEHNRKFPIINRCPFFRVDDLRLAERWPDSTDGNSFHLITAVNNPVTITRYDISVKVDKGSTCMIPASFGDYSIIIEEGKETTVIRTTL